MAASKSIEFTFEHAVVATVLTFQSLLMFVFRLRFPIKTCVTVINRYYCFRNNKYRRCGPAYKVYHPWQDKGTREYRQVPNSRLYLSWTMCWHPRLNITDVSRLGISVIFHPCDLVCLKEAGILKTGLCICSPQSSWLPVSSYHLNLQWHCQLFQFILHL